MSEASHRQSETAHIMIAQQTKERDEDALRHYIIRPAKMYELH